MCKRGIEFGTTGEKCKMLRRRLGGIGKVERDAGDAHGHEPAPFRPSLDPRDAGEKPRRRLFVLRAEDYLIEFDGHLGNSRGVADVARWPAPANPASIGAVATG